MAGLVASDEAHGVEVRHEEISMDEHGGVVLTKEMGEGGGLLGEFPREAVGFGAGEWTITATEVREGGVPGVRPESHSKR
jgi:hypothetical protein